MRGRGAGFSISRGAAVSTQAVPQGYTLEKCPVCLGSKKVGGDQDCCHCNAWGAMPYYDTGLVTLFHGRALDVLGLLGDGSVSLIFCDSPYYKVKDLAWDNQWKSEGEFLAWIGVLCDEFKRVLAPNGSLYLCASPAMAWGVEGEVRKRFNVLNSIRWYKDAGWHKKAEVEALRSYLEPWEAVIFAEQQGYANSERGDVDGISISVFEPIRVYLDSERKRAGINFEQVRQMVGCAPGSGLPSHWFTRSQWMMPTEENYIKLQKGFNSNGSNEFLCQEYEYLRQEYEDLRAEYESLRRPFFLSKDRPSTDLWTYEPVQADDIKHETEKPLPMLLDIVETSSRPGDLVVDPFLGRGATAVAAQRLGRRFVGCDIQEHWVGASKARLLEAKGEMHLRPKRPAEPPKAPKGQIDIFQMLQRGLEQ